MAKILVTDDSGFLRKRTCAILKNAGHEVFEAENGEQCLEKLADIQPDCLFLDLIMPVMDGFEVLKTLQDAKNTIPVIVLTADIQESVQKECLGYGASSFLNKPPKESEVTDALNKALGH
ncbi:MAG: response regulator [Mariprofundaceae bacterium]